MLPPTPQIGMCPAADGQRSPIRRARPRPHGRSMDQIVTPIRLRGAAGCREGGCAGLCTEEGLRAADAAHRTKLLARARRIVGDPALAEEAVQEALVRAWCSCSSFDPASGPLAPWLLALTRNAAIDLARWRSRRPPVAATADPADGPGHLLT